MLPIRIKACSESDLRMLGNLARNIQRVLPVTQADIDAAAALGKGWVVWKVIEVNDPIDNLRGGTQLVIKQNSVQPGQNVRRVLIVSGPGGETVVIGPGPSPLLLPDAIADTLSYVKAFGGTELRKLPSGYTQVGYIYFLASSYLITNINPTYDGRYEFDFQTTTLVSGSATTYLGVRPSSSENGGLRVARISSRVFRIYGFGSYQDSTTNVVADTRYKFVWNNQHAVMTSGGNTVFDLTYENTDACAYPITINGWNSAGSVTPGSEGIFVYSFKAWNAQGELVADYVPTKDPDGVVGFYDMVSESFKTATAGTIAAGPDAAPIPTPDAPVDIVCNNGALKVKDSELPVGYKRLKNVKTTGDVRYISNVYLTGSDTLRFTFQASPGNLLGSYNDSSANDNYSFYNTTGATGSYARYNGQTGGSSIYTGTTYSVIMSPTGITGIRNPSSFTPTEFTCSIPFCIFATSPTGSEHSNATIIGSIEVSGSQTLKFIPCERISDGAIGFWETSNQEFLENQENGTPTTDGYDTSYMTEIYADGTVETIEDTIGNTATCEYLLAFDADHIDEQEIKSGTVTRKVSALVLTGDEDGWVKGNNVTIYNLGVWSTPIQYSPDRLAVYCTHYVGTDATNSNSPDKSIKLSNSSYFSGNGTVIIKDSSCADLAAWKAFLKSQYLAGTPVIVVIPAESTTTESVAGQTLQVADGANTLTITQAGMNGLQLEAEYEKAV